MYYTNDLGDKICQLTASSSIGLRQICAGLGLPYSTVSGWVYDQNHDLYPKYKEAKEAQLQYLNEEILEIADDDSKDLITLIRGDKTYEVLNRVAVTRSKVRIQARQWTLARLAPVSKNAEPEFTPATIIIKKSRGAQIPDTEEAREHYNIAGR